MKQKLVLRNILLCCGAFLLVAAFAFSFLVRGIVVTGSNSMMYYQGVLWGNGKVIQVVGSTTTSYMIDEERRYVAVAAIIGFIVMAVAGIAAVVLKIVLKKENAERVALIGCGAVALVGAILTFIPMNLALHCYAMEFNMSLENAKQAWDVLLNWNEKVSFLHVVLSIAGIVGAGLIGAAGVLKAKKK